MVNRVLSVVCNVKFNHFFIQATSPIRGSNISYMNLAIFGFDMAIAHPLSEDRP